MQGKKIILGVCGGIAAYKTPLLVRILVKQGAEVKVICTPDALNFVTKGALATVSKNPVLIDFKNETTGEWNNHVELGLWADVLLIAPCTANTLSKMANGQANNLLLATYMSCRSKVFFAPAMDLDMFEHKGVQTNIKNLINYGCEYIEPETGDLASGLFGKGRLPEPQALADCLALFFNAVSIKKQKNPIKILITAGPTHESIDPVRFIGNYSSGKMGYAIATSFVNEGCEVFLISGPTSLPTPKGLNFVSVKSALEMQNEVEKIWSNCNIAIMTAAVADYRPAITATQKIKKDKTDSISLELIKNPDILAYTGKNKTQNQLVVGFALETENEIENAKLKLKSKNADVLFLNSANAAGGVFGSDSNEITLVTSSEIKPLGLHSKTVMADLLKSIIFEKYEVLN